MNGFRSFSFRSFCFSLLSVVLGFGSQSLLAQDQPDHPLYQGISSQLARSPDDPTLQRAEINYRARRLTAAMEQFGMIAALNDHPFAWLRVGNILHRRGDVVGALDAYRRAHQAAGRERRYAPLGARAMMNQALLGLDQAQAALDALTGAPARQATSPWIAEVRTRLDELSAALPNKPAVDRAALAGTAPTHTRIADAGQ